MKKLFAVFVLVPALALAATLTQLDLSRVFQIQHQPVAATQATISTTAKAATRYVATSLTVCVTATAAQPRLVFNLRDGATGAGTILWSASLGSPTVGQTVCQTANGVWVGSVNTAMTLESSAAPAATNFAQVSLQGYATPGS